MDTLLNLVAKAGVWAVNKLAIRKAAEDADKAEVEARATRVAAELAEDRKKTVP